MENARNEPVRGRRVGALSLLILLGTWPFLVYLDAVPLQPDSIKWIENAIPGSEGWFEWTFHSSHFVGYRPLTALSFTADQWLFGASAPALRWTDFGLHLFSALAVFSLARRLALSGGAGRSSRFFAGSASLAWFLFHAGVDEVVPFLSRRSYPLAVSLAFAGLLAADFVSRQPIDAPRRGLSLLAAAALGPLLLASMFSNELGALLAMALPLVVFASAAASPLRRTAIVTVWGWAWIAAGVWVRQRILEGDSGYEVDATEPGRALEIWKVYGAGLAGHLGQASKAWCGAQAAVGVYYLIVCLALARARARSLPLGLLLVIAVYGAVVVSEAVWFPRQIYPATALVALVVGLVAAWTIGGETPVLRLPRWAHAIPQVALFALMGLHSPVRIGAAPIRVERARVATSFAGALRAGLDQLDEPAEVYAVAPIPEPIGDVATERRVSLRASEGRARARLSALRVPFRWLRVAYPGAPWTLRDVLYVVDPSQTHPPAFDTAARSLSLPPGTACFGVPRRQIVELPAGQDSFVLPKRRAPGRPALLWIYGSSGFQSF